MPERTKLDDWLFQHGMTQSALAARLGIHVSTVNRAVKEGVVTAGLWLLFSEDYGRAEAILALGEPPIGRKSEPPAEAQP